MPKPNLVPRTIEHIWSVLCTGSSVDSQTNNVTLFNVLEQLNLTRKHDAPPINLKNGEALPFQMELVSLWRKQGIQDAVTGTIRNVLLNPLGQEIGSQTMPLEIKSPNRRMRSRVQINGIQITGPGYYTWQVRLTDGKNDEVVANIPFEILINEESK